MSSDTYEIYAIKYAQHERRTRENFLGGDIHDGPMAMDYFIWVIRNALHTIIVDTGFDQAMADKRKRRIVRPVEEGLAKLGIAPTEVKDVVLTHLHYDHAGNHHLFPNARFHVQERELAFCTGRCMCHPEINHPYAVEDVKVMIDRLFSGRLSFREPEDVLLPGITLHRVGGHSDGLQILRVSTERGWVVLASDAAHYFANLVLRLAYPVVFNLRDMFEGYKRVRELADSEAHVIPGHDPKVLSIYPPAYADSDGWIARLDLPPVNPHD
ncbi:N-acyl homoserine lactonase family protein [Halomonas daqingensis]|uniref:N-acyl homoserine lactonase family protein n=1 Tax=Billgrantia desiderata TaxID=52021 RepID=A0ABS9BAE8_9GAMM|nr:N-acyl homoserine lactonase family protein [Halomonas desiderata]MCE8048965.1 N-acyl homoserine lactonase family protein [Halomonas desiderata]